VINKVDPTRDGNFGAAGGLGQQHKFPGDDRFGAVKFKFICAFYHWSGAALPIKM
jgi:hypothetical protein